MPDRPPGPRGILGRSQLWYLRRRPEVFLRLARRHGDVMSFRIGPREIWLVSRPDLIERILRDHYAFFVKDWGPQRGTSGFGNGLLTSEGAEHRAQRQELSRVFSRASIESRRDAIHAVVDEWADSRRDGEAIDVFHEMSMLNARIAARVLFGCDIDPRQLLEAVFTIERRFTRHMFPYAGRLRFRRPLGNELRDVVATIRREGQGGLLDPFGDDDRIATFVITALETTRIATSWAWHLLGAHPEAHERMTDERFAEAVLKESLRLYPPQWMIGRRVIAPYPLDGFEVPVGALVLMSPYIVQRDPRYFADPLAFRPERWFEPTPREAFFPFGGGPRRCIGEAFAYAIGIATLSRVAGRWRVECGREVGEDVRLTLQPHGMRATLRAV